MLEKQLIEHCSPTLASLKTANLFTYRYAEEDGLMESVSQWNRPQITMTLPWRFIILHFSHIGLTEGLTFI